MNILNNSNSNIDKILKNDEKRSAQKYKKAKGKSPTTSEKSMNINYNPKAHQIFDMTDSEDKPNSPIAN